jgi:hypothetical protein
VFEQFAIRSRKLSQSIGCGSLDWVAVPYYFCMIFLQFSETVLSPKNEQCGLSGGGEGLINIL